MEVSGRLESAVLTVYFKMYQSVHVYNPLMDSYAVFEPSWTIAHEYTGADGILWSCIEADLEAARSKCFHP